MDTKHKKHGRPDRAAPKPSNRKAELLHAKFTRPNRIELKFADGFSGSWSFRQLELDMKDMDLTSIKASRSGKFIAVKSKSGDRVQLDSSWLRALVDGRYAAEMEQRLDELANH